MGTPGLDCSLTLAPFLDLDAIGSLSHVDSDPDMPDAEGSPIIPKTEHSREASLSSIESSPGPDVDVDLEGHQSAPANVQVQKRKGGRKPVRAPACAVLQCLSDT